jgi:uncharacterized protein GlcG (DUF336 family)
MLNLVQASLIVDTALAKGRELNLKPLTIAVLDSAGCLVAFKREDNTSLMRPEIAQAKAWGVLALGMGGRALAERAQHAPAFIATVTALAQGRVVPVAGGVIVRDSVGKVMGSVGVSGDLPDSDEACAVAGIAAAGLVADTGAGGH